MKPKKIDLGQVKKKFGPYGEQRANGDLVVFYVSAYNEEEADVIAHQVADTIAAPQMRLGNNLELPEPSLN